MMDGSDGGGGDGKGGQGEDKLNLLMRLKTESVSSNVHSRPRQASSAIFNVSCRTTSRPSVEGATIVCFFTRAQIAIFITFKIVLLMSERYACQAQGRGLARVVPGSDRTPNPFFLEFRQGQLL